MALRCESVGCVLLIVSIPSFPDDDGLMKIKYIDDRKFHESR